MGALISCVALNLCECAACMACTCCSSIINVTMSQAARLGHLIVYILLFVLALILGRHYQQYIVEDSVYTYYTVDVSSSLNIDTMYEGCNENYYVECVFRQLIYRASFTLFLFFGGMMVLTSCSDYINRSMWTLKLMIVVGLFIAFWYGSNGFFSGFAEFCRYVSFAWLLIQALLILDIGFDLHDIILPIAQNTEDWASGIAKVGYLFLTVVFFVLSITGYVYLFGDYYGCDTGKSFVMVTIIVTIIETLLSMLNIVNRGILTPSFMMAYAVFMCWYALLSNPEESCNPSADINNGEAKNTSVFFVSIISFVVLLFCVINGTTMMQIFMPSGEGVLESSYGTRPVGQKSDGSLDGVLTGEGGAQGRSGPPDPIPQSQQLATQQPPDASGGPRERMFFHALMMVASCYGAMVLTSWAKTDGSPESDGSADSYAGASSMWLKIVSQWVFLGIYLKALHAAYLNNQA